MPTTSRLSNRVRRGRQIALVALIAVFAVVAAAESSSATSSKIAPNPSAVTLTEGQSHDVQFTLDAPIIAPVGGTPDVTINFTVSDPSRVTLSANSLTWTAPEWFQVRTLTLHALHDGVHDASNSVTLQYVAVSDSAYYSGFTGAVTVTINDIDAAPTTTTTTTTTATSSTTSTTVATTTSTAAAVASKPATTISGGEMPRTGTTPRNGAILGIALLAIGATLLTAARGRRRAS
ncbi:MAG TPA: hypothetical protein VEZ15_05805 [Acidimicrobiia bacterium]|nr:hypothetical protein [Acidimicrobiia bacterium]